MIVSVKDSVKNLKNQIKEKHDQIRLRAIVIERFPNTNIEISSIEDGSFVFICDGVNLSNVTSVHFTYDTQSNRFVIRPYLEIKARRKKPIRVYAPNSYCLNRGNVLDILNKFGSMNKLSKLPDSVQSLFGAIFANETDKIIDQTMLKANESIREAVV